MGTKRVAFVTGGGGGIGGAICRALAADGLNVAVADMNVDSAKEVADDIDALAVSLEVTDSDSVDAAVKKTEEELGPVDVLVNCAGWDVLMPFVDIDEALMIKVIDINLQGPMRTVRAVLPGMIERKWGRVINIASDAGRVGSSLESVYSGAKGGIIAFTKTVAREVARRGITANSVCPGPTDTPLLAGITSAGADGEKVIAAMTRAVPMKRLGKPEDLGPAVAFLASEEAGFITGQTLSISGGLTMV